VPPWATESRAVVTRRRSAKLRYGISSRALYVTTRLNSSPANDWR
jgi:hypothetical protein